MVRIDKEAWYKKEAGDSKSLTGYQPASFVLFKILESIDLETQSCAHESLVLQHSCADANICSDSSLWSTHGGPSLGLQSWSLVYNKEPREMVKDERQVFSP